MWILSSYAQQFSGEFRELSTVILTVLPICRIHFYTVAGRLAEIHTANGMCSIYSYDRDGNLSRLHIAGTEENSLLYDCRMSYDLNGNRCERTGKYLGAEGQLQEFQVAYAYDAMNRLTAEGSGNAGVQYHYDQKGNRIRQEHFHGERVGDKKREERQTESYRLDQVITYDYNKRNQLIQQKNPSFVMEYTYDENGSLLHKKEGDKTTTYHYDLLNRQQSITLPDGRKQEALYDGEGLRAGVRESGVTTTFLFYQGEILAEWTQSQTPEKRYLRDHGLSQVEVK